MTDILNLGLEDNDAAFKSLLESAAPAPRGLTAQQRREALVTAIQKFDLERLIDLQDKMARTVDQIVANEIDADSTETLTPAELESFMREFLDEQEITDLLKLRYDAIRTRVFGHITAINVEQGLPGESAAEVEVPEMGKKFVRQGGKPKVRLDHEKLAELLGAERWGQVHSEVTIPARVETKVNQDALLALVHADPAVMEIVRQCVTQDGTTPQSFHVRNLKG